MQLTSHYNKIKNSCVPMYNVEFPRINEFMKRLVKYNDTYRQTKGDIQKIDKNRSRVRDTHYSKINLQT